MKTSTSLLLSFSFWMCTSAWAQQPSGIPQPRLPSPVQKVPTQNASRQQVLQQLWRGVLEYEHGNYEAARKDLQAVMRAEPGNRMAQTYERLTEEAIHHRNQPTHPVANSQWAKERLLWIAKQQYAEADFEAAQENLRAVLVAEPGNGEAQRYAALVAKALQLQRLGQGNPTKSAPQSAASAASAPTAPSAPSAASFQPSPAPSQGMDTKPQRAVSRTTIKIH